MSKIAKVETKVKLDRKGNERSNSKVKSEFIKVKKVITDDKVTKRIKGLSLNKGKPKNKVSHVLPITDWLYITCDSFCWKLMEINDGVSPTTGEKYRDKPLKYTQHLDEMLSVCAHMMLKIPGDVVELNENFTRIYNLINSRIPADIKPADLFKDVTRGDNDGEE